MKSSGRLTALRRIAARLRRELFETPQNTALTVLAVGLILATVPSFLRWALVDADWVGTGRDACSGDGACWVFIRVRLNQFVYGFYPTGEQWRVNLALLLVAGGLVAGASRTLRHRKRAIAVLAATLPVTAFILLRGGVVGLAPVETSRWGGLMLTLSIAATGIAAALPLGILLALGRRSSLPVLRYLSIGYIEFWRGVPLITVLFMASVMLPIFLPEGVSFGKLGRALIGIILFETAYMAEVVRGGLQAIPKGQYEAAASLGLGYWRTTGLVVLPQALRHVIPGIVNTTIALFKDTALVLVIGIFDLLGIVQAAFADPDWLGFSREGYLFAGALFWCFCFGMSRWSRRLERRLGARSAPAEGGI